MNIENKYKEKLARKKINKKKRRTQHTRDSRFRSTAGWNVVVRVTLYRPLETPAAVSRARLALVVEGTRYYHYVTGKFLQIQQWKQIIHDQSSHELNRIFVINWVVPNFCSVQEIPNSSRTDSLDGHDDTEAPACLLPPPPIPPLLPAIYPHYSRCSFLLYFSNHAGFFPTTPPSLPPASHSTLSYLYPRSQLSYECSASNLFLPSLTTILSSFLLYPFSVSILISLNPDPPRCPCSHRFPYAVPFFSLRLAFTYTIRVKLFLSFSRVNSKHKLGRYVHSATRVF